MSKIINARVKEIIELVNKEIENYGHGNQRRKLIAGIVLTGGGAQLKHLRQLVELVTGLDTRIGYPNEHLAGDSDDELSSPLYATAVGLLMKGLNDNIVDEEEVEEEKKEEVQETKQPVEKRKELNKPKKEEDSKSIFGKFAEKFTNRFQKFLDNIED